MQITSANNKPAKYEDLWWGTAIAGDDKFEWFYQPKLYLHMRREEPRIPGCWMNLDPPRRAKRAVLEAIRVAKGL
jgi:hypothetical protein